MSPADQPENKSEAQNSDSQNEDRGKSQAPEVEYQPSTDYEVGRRSITTRGAVSRRQLVEQKHRRSLKSRPFILGATIALIGLLAIPVYAYFQVYVFPPRELALRVGDFEYTSGDVVNFIRFNQRMSEDLGVPFEVGNSLFDALQTLQDNELAFQLAPRYGITVTPEEVDERVDSILGFVATTVAERESKEYQNNREEAKRQFIHRIGMDEDVFRDFIRKSMFKERLREVVAEGIERVQPQAHVYEIVLFDRDLEIKRAIERDLRGGDPIEEVTVRYSDDANVRRHFGEMGWFPFGVSPEIDALLFGLDGDGNRLLPLRTPSDGRFDAEANWWSYIIVDEMNDAREVDAASFEQLTTRALVIFFNEERAQFDPYIVLNNKVVDWVNNQVRLSALIPTPTPVPFGQQLQQLPGVQPVGP